MIAFLLIGLGGVLGANARYLVSVWAAGRWGVSFPYGTLVINVSGSFAMGFVLEFLSAYFSNNADVRLFLATGFLGAYTTFSTFAFETIALARERDHRPALVNAFGSAGLGIATATAGYLLAFLVSGQGA